MPAETLIAVGRLIKPHGLKGEVVFLPYVYDVDMLPDLIDETLVLRHATAPTLTLTMVDWRLFNKRVLMRFDQFRDVDQAETLREYEVWIPQDLFPELPEGEYYWFEIEGLPVYASDDRCLGTITEIIHTGSNDVYVVSDDTGEVLVPALRNTVQEIDIERGEIRLLVTAEELQ